MISKGHFDLRELPGLPNSYSKDNITLNSPYGPIWFEWPVHLAKSKAWDDAVQHEMVLLCGLVISGWIQVNNEPRLPSDALEDLGRRLSAVTMSNETSSENVSPCDTSQSRVTDDTSKSALQPVRRFSNASYSTPIRYPSTKSGRHVSFSDSKTVNHSDIPFTTSPINPYRRGGLRGTLGHRSALSWSIPGTKPLDQ